MESEVSSLLSSTGHIVYFIHPRDGSLSAENDFAIAQWQSESEKEEPFTVKGALFGMHKNERVTLHGRWEDHARYGQQFVVVHWERPLPQTADQIAAYLSSKFVKGCGEKRAQLIVEQLGEQTIERIMQEGPDCLIGIKGIGFKNATKIADSLKSSFEIQQIMMTLLPYGISADTITKAYKQWGAECVDVIRRNPYRLTEIHLIGFLKADGIAVNIGVAKDSPYRLNAAVQHALNEACYGNGHCYLPEAELLGLTTQLLSGVDERQVQTEIDLMSAHEQIIIEDDRVYPKSFYYYEKKLAYKLACMTNRPGEAMPFLDSVIRHVQKKQGFVMAKQQQEAIRKLFQEQLLIVTGNPGTGKTTVVRAMIEAYQSQYPEARIGLCAPTGRAARKLGKVAGLNSETTHTMLGLRPGADPIYGEDMPLEYDLVIADEVSMKDLQLAYYFFQAIGSHTKVVLIGDSDQLPSVGPGNVLHDLIAAGIPHVRLTEIFRQAQDSQIIMNAHRINKGQMIVLDPDKKDFFFIEKQNPEQIAQLIIRSTMRFIEKGYSIEDILILTPMKKGVIGTEELNRILQATVNPPASTKSELVVGGRVYRQGDKVIQDRRNRKKKILNGEIGVVVGTAYLENEEGELTHEVGLVCQFEERQVIYAKHELKDLLLAYATTIHKAQGGQAPIVIMPISTAHLRMLARNLVYTGSTRAEQINVMIGTRRALWIAIQNNQIVQRYTGLAERIRHYMDQSRQVGWEASSL